MNQQIGIQFSATGADTVVGAVKKIESQLKQLQASLTKLQSGLDLSAGLGKAAQTMEAFAGSVTKAAGAAGGMSALANSINQVVAATSKLAQVQRQLKPMSTALPPGSGSALQPQVTASTTRANEQAVGIPHPFRGIRADNNNNHFTHPLQARGYYHRDQTPFR